MGSPPILDIESLIEPISPDRVVGEDPRVDASPGSVYYQIKDARTQARAAERQALTATDEDVARADWRPILSVAPQLLATQAKDLEITAYLIEALAREHGFSGLRDGFRLARELVARFGDDIYPLPDEDGIETRVAPLTGLNGEGADGTLIAPIANIPLTASSSVGQFARSHYEQAQDLERAPDDARERRISQGAVAMSTFQIAANETSGEFCAILMEDIRECIDEFKQCGDLLDDKYGDDAPPTSNIRHALQACQDALAAFAQDKLAVILAAEEELAAGDEQAADAEAGAAPRQAKAVVGAIENREDAFREILKISQYFRKTEPHSPISYALEQIVRWGRLPLPELLKELINDESSVSQMFRLVGISSSEDFE